MVATLARPPPVPSALLCEHAHQRLINRVNLSKSRPPAPEKNRLENRISVFPPVSGRGPIMGSRQEIILLPKFPTTRLWDADSREMGREFVFELIENPDAWATSL